MSFPTLIYVQVERLSYEQLLRNSNFLNYNYWYLLHSVLE